VTPEFWKDRRVLVTGHTGFKGAWLCLWLTSMGAKVSGLSREAAGEPNLWNLLGLGRVKHYVGDVSDLMDVENVLACERPDVVLHLAAQALVRQSYASPIDTYASNVMGVVTILDALMRDRDIGQMLSEPRKQHCVYRGRCNGRRRPLFRFQRCC